VVKRSRDVILINKPISLSATLEIPLSIQITSQSLKSLQAPLSLDEMAGVMLACALDTARPPSASSTNCNLRYLGGAFYPGKLKKELEETKVKHVRVFSLCILWNLPFFHSSWCSFG